MVTSSTFTSLVEEAFPTFTTSAGKNTTTSSSQGKTVLMDDEKSATQEHDGLPQQMSQSSRRLERTRADLASIQVEVATIAVALKAASKKAGAALFSRLNSRFCVISVPDTSLIHALQEHLDVTGTSICDAVFHCDALSSAIAALKAFTSASTPSKWTRDLGRSKIMRDK